ncbi:hypothetical protein C8Q78DRAFT_1144380 [Trametes maxima]|nr:hypothetical protein C8Q78DRAFT_1144380 [Trametes maxima]
MIVYPLALIAALLLSALSNLSATLFASSSARFDIPLVSVAPYYSRSFDRPLLTGAPLSSLDYDACSAPLATQTCHWVYSSAPPASATVDIPSAELALRPAPLTPSAPRRLPAPAPTLRLTSTALPASYFGRLVDASVVCCYLALLYWLVEGTAQVAAYFWYRVAFAVDVQRMESPWSLYSVGLFSETSDVSRYGAPGLLEYNLARAPRTARFLRPVLPALATPPSPSPPPPPPQPPLPLPPSPVLSQAAKDAHRGRRGGKREQRRRRTQEHVAKMAVLTAFLQAQPTIVDAPQYRPSIWDHPVDTPPAGDDFATDGSGRVISSTGTLIPFPVDSPAPQSTPAPLQPPSPSSAHKPPLPPTPASSTALAEEHRGPHVLALRHAAEDSWDPGLASEAAAPSDIGDGECASCADGETEPASAAGRSTGSA